MKKILFISAHYPSERSRYAGHKIALQNIRDYDANNTVDVLIAANHDEEDPRFISSLNNTRLIQFIPLTKWRKLCNIARSGHLFPIKVWTRFSPAVIEYVRQNAQDYDIVHFEFTHAAAVLCALDGVSKKPKIVVTCHDILIQGRLREAEQSINAISGFDIAATFRFENQLFSVVDEIICLCQKDHDLIRSLYAVPKEKLHIIDPFISPFAAVVKTERTLSTIHPKSLLFWGAMNRKENEEAVLTFLDRFGHQLAENGYTLFVVGNAPSERVKKLASEHVVVTGFVEDPSPYFLMAEIGVVPLLSGAGIKVKTLEMLRAGIPVVSTAIGAEGIENTHLYVAELNDIMAKVELLRCELVGNI